jgi:hypothetical protein
MTVFPLYKGKGRPADAFRTVFSAPRTSSSVPPSFTQCPSVRKSSAKSVKKLILCFTGALLTEPASTFGRRGVSSASRLLLRTPERDDRGAGRARTPSSGVPLALWFASLKHACAVFHSPKSQNGGRSPLEYFRSAAQEGGRGRLFPLHRRRGVDGATPPFGRCHFRGRRRLWACRRRVIRSKKSTHCLHWDGVGP